MAVCDIVFSLEGDLILMNALMELFSFNMLSEAWQLMNASKPPPFMVYYN